MLLLRNFNKSLSYRAEEIKNEEKEYAILKSKLDKENKYRRLKNRFLIVGIGYIIYIIGN